MTPIEFTLWLDGFFELATTGSLSSTQVEAIKNHLKTVDNKLYFPLTPSKGGEDYVEFRRR